MSQPMPSHTAAQVAAAKLIMKLARYHARLLNGEGERLVADALAEREAAVRAWQPMSSAPDDGTLVLLIGVDKYGSDRERIIASRWKQLDHGGFGWEFSCPGYGSEFAPFAWSPLPDDSSAVALREAARA